MATKNLKSPQLSSLRALFVGVFVTLCLSIASAMQAQDIEPYKHKLNRVAETLGALTLLDQLCDGNDPVDWRAYMQRLLKSETQGSQASLDLVNNFNEGFESLRLSYNSCTPSAHYLRSIYFEESIDTISDLITFYGF